MKKHGKAVYILNVDAAELICRRKSPFTGTNQKVNSSLTLEYIIYRTPNEYICYLKGFNVIYNNKKVGRLYTDFYTKKQRDRTLFVVENSLLYVKGCHKIILKILTALDQVFEKFDRLDIAIDGQGFLKKWSELEKSNVYSVITDVKQLGWSVKNKKWEFLFMGSLSGRQILSVYDKTKELKEKDEEYKHYIKENWIANGMPEDGVERLELRLFKSKLRGIKHSLSLLENKQALAAIAKRWAYKWITFRHSKNKSYKSIVEWDSFGDLPDNALTEQIEHIPERLQSIKTAIKALDIEALERSMYERDSDDEIIDVINSLLEIYDLHEWYFINKKKWNSDKRKVSVHAFTKQLKTYNKKIPPGR
jgi:hypothetical protein